MYLHTVQRMAALLTLISICAVSENTSLSVAFRIKDGNKLTTALQKSTILEIRVAIQTLILMRLALLHSMQYQQRSK